MIEYFIGVDGVSVEIESQQEAYEILDILHTQLVDSVIDNADEIAEIFNKAMIEIEDKFEVETC